MLLLVTKTLLSPTKCFCWSLKQFFRPPNDSLGHQTLLSLTKCRNASLSYQNNLLDHRMILLVTKQFFCSPNIPLINERLVSITQDKLVLNTVFLNLRTVGSKVYLHLSATTCIVKNIGISPITTSLLRIICECLVRPYSCYGWSVC